MPLPLKDIQSTLEQKRSYLEKQLGAQKFIQAYPSIQVGFTKKSYMNYKKYVYVVAITFVFKNCIENEETDMTEKSKKLSDRKSFELFRKKFPTSDTALFDDFYQLVMANKKINE